MANIGSDFVTLPDLGKRLKQGKTEEIAAIIEILAQSNPVLDDMPFVMCNNGTVHRVTRRSKLPDAFWRSINQGVPASKSETRQIDEQTGQLAVWSQVDRDLAALNGNTQAFMLSEESAFLETMNQQMAKNLFYGNKAEFDAKFTGLAPRYSTLDPEKAETAGNVVNAGGTGADNTSAWLIHWDPRTATGIYPNGLPSGLQRVHRRDVDIRDRDGNEFIGHKSFYTWNMGLAIPDHRYVVRVANIGVSQLKNIIKDGAATAASQALVRHMLDALNRIPNKNVGKPVWYMNRTVKLMLDIMAAEKANVNLSVGEFEGKPVTQFYGIPVREVDAIVDDEVAVA
jgi:hypothetical protein